MMRLYLIISLLSLSISLPASVSTPLSSRRGDCGETPQTLAKHFCRLLVCDNDHRVMPLSAFIRQQTPLSDDSLTIEQLFTTYVFDYQGWQTLRIFPHQAADGTIRWYAPTDPLPKDMSVKVVEPSYERCQKLGELLQNRTMIINGEGHDMDLLEDENIDSSEAFIALTPNDEVNILACVAARRRGGHADHAHRRRERGGPDPLRAQRLPLL